MTQRWVEAGGEYQIPFINAGERILKGEQVACPKCSNELLRYYFHIMNVNRGSGTLWIWCANCHTGTHLPRVQPNGLKYQDPFSELDLEEFSKLELDQQNSLLDRVDRLWSQNLLQ